MVEHSSQNNYLTWSEMDLKVYTATPTLATFTTYTG